MVDEPSRLILQPHGGALKPARPGERRNPSGRPKGSLYPSEAYRHLSGMNRKQLEEIAKRESANAVLRICASMLLLALDDPALLLAGKKDRLDRGIIQWFSDFTDRLDGKARQHIVQEVYTVPPPAVLARQLAEHITTLDEAERAFLADLVRDPAGFLARRDSQQAALPSDDDASGNE